MYFSNSFVFFALPFFTLAIPMARLPMSNSSGILIPLTKRNNSSPVDSVKIGNEVKRNIAKFRMGIATSQNNTGILHPLSETSVKRDRISLDIETGMKDSAQSRYYGTFEVGEPSEPFDMLFDTGSRFFVLRSQQGSDSEHHELYDYEASSSARPILLPAGAFSIEYDGLPEPVYGRRFIDTVAIGDYGGYLVVDELTLSVASKIPNLITDGIMGMGFGIDYPTFFDSLVNQGKLLSPMFAFKFTDDGESHLQIGGMNSAHYQGNIAWVTVPEKTEWLAPVEIRVNGISISEGPIAVIFDTGAPKIYGPRSTIKKLYSYYPHSEKGPDGHYTYKCDTETTTMSVVVNGMVFDIPPTEFSLGSDPGKPGFCIGAAYSFKTRAFKSLTNKYKDILVLGMTYLQTVYSIWDIGDPTTSGKARIGFAHLKK